MHRGFERNRSKDVERSFFEKPKLFQILFGRERITIIRLGLKAGPKEVQHI